MTKSTPITQGIITKIDRLPSSGYGNPAYRLTLDTPWATGVQYRTSANAGIAYAIGNHMIGQHVELTLTKAWRITNISTVMTVDLES